MSKAGSARERAAHAWARPSTDTTDTRATSAAEQLLGSVAVIQGAARILLGYPEPAVQERRELLLIVQSQAELLHTALSDVARAIPDRVVADADPGSGT